MTARAPVSLLLALGIALAGCAREYEVVRTIPTGGGAATNPWIGKSEAEIVEAWGDPAAVDSDVDGDRILVYRGKPRWLGLSVESRTTTASGATESVEFRSDETSARFWLDAGGRVTRTWFEPRLWRDGVPTPPAAKKKAEAGRE